MTQGCDFLSSAHCLVARHKEEKRLQSSRLLIVGTGIPRLSQADVSPSLALPTPASVVKSRRGHRVPFSHVVNLHFKQTWGQGRPPGPTFTRLASLKLLRFTWSKAGSSLHFCKEVEKLILGLLSTLTATSSFLEHQPPIPG